MKSTCNCTYTCPLFIPCIEFHVTRMHTKFSWSCLHHVQHVEQACANVEQACANAEQACANAEQACANVPAKCDKSTCHGNLTRLALQLLCMKLHHVGVRKELPARSMRFSALDMWLEAESGLLLVLTLNGLVQPRWRSPAREFRSDRVDKEIGTYSPLDVRTICV